MYLEQVNINHSCLITSISKLERILQKRKFVCETYFNLNFSNKKRLVQHTLLDQKENENIICHKSQIVFKLFAAKLGTFLVVYCILTRIIKHVEKSISKVNLWSPKRIIQFISNQSMLLHQTFTRSNFTFKFSVSNLF